MDISPHTRCRLYQGAVFLLPPRKHPDRLILDWLYCTGEFSIWAELARERHLKWLLKDKRAHSFIPVPALV